MTRFLKKIARWLMILLAVGVGLLSIYLLWLLLKSYWAPVLFFSYLAIGIVTVLLGLIGLFIARKQANSDSLFLIFAEAAANTNILKIRQLIGKALGFVVLATGGWIPAAYYALRAGRVSLSQNAAGISLQGLDQRYAPLTLLMTVIAFCAAWLQPTENYWIKLFLATLVIHVIARQLEYAIMPLSLPIRLRRQLGNAYVSFLLIAISDVSTLVLILSAITNWTVFQIPTQPALIETFKGIFFGHATELVKRVWDGNSVPPNEAFLTGIGALLSLNFLETAYKFREFHRNDEDNITVASRSMLIGRFADALVALDQVKSRNGAYFASRANAHLGVSQLERAWQDAQQAIALERQSAAFDANAKQPAAAEIFLTLATSAVFLSIPQSALVSLLKRAFQNGVSDYYLANGLMMMFMNATITPQARAEIAELAEQRQLLLFRAVSLLQLKEFEQARLQLEGARPNQPAESFFCSSMLIIVTLTDPKTTLEQDKEAFSSWSSKALEQMSQIDWKSVDPLDIGVTWGRVLHILQISEKLEPQHQQSWQYVLTELGKFVPANASRVLSPSNLQKALQRII
jgi:hypothetical protein